MPGLGVFAYVRADKQARGASQRLAGLARQDTTRVGKRGTNDRGPALFD